MKCSVMTDAYSHASGCLPHTGLDVWPIFLAGVVLLVSGLLCYWGYLLVSRRPDLQLVVRPRRWPPIRWK